MHLVSCLEYIFWRCVSSNCVIILISGVIEFLTNGKVAANHEDFKDNVYDQVMKKMCNGDKTHIYHNFQLSRAYSDIMPFTNYT